MPRHWVIAPVESKDRELFDKVWQFDLANNTISIGWTQLGDVSHLTHEQLLQAVASEWPENKRPSVAANMLWNFYHEISVGDVVIARRGRRMLEAVGEVTKHAVYVPGKNPDLKYPHFLEVSWRIKPRGKSFDSMVFTMNTVV